jgi:folate-binding protein YgfZ
MTQWHDFLNAQGAVFQNGELQSFGDSKKELQAANSNIITSLSHLGLLEISGEDAVSFLQGQVTNDVKKLDGSISQYAGYCSPKGRLLALFLAYAHLDHLHLQMPLSILEPIMKRLKMFVMRSKVVITDKSADILCFGIAGPNAESTLTSLFSKAPQSPQELITLDDATLLRLAGDMPRYQVFTHTVNAERIWNALSANCTKVGKSVWDYLEIQAGIPEVVPATQEAFVPQMVNLDALDGINFKKGCYTGQEIVARTHYLGKVKRRTQLAHINTDEMPLAGDMVQLAGHEEAIGQIVRATPSPKGGVDALIEIRLENLESTEEFPVWKDKKLEFKALPYALT